VSGVKAIKSLDPVNQDLRTGGIRALAVLGTTAAAHATAVALYLNELKSPLHYAWLGASVLLGTLLVAATWGALRSMRTRITEEGLIVEGLSETTSTRWADVVRLRRDSRRIMLERIGAPATVISLWYVCRPDELHAAIRELVPSRALQRAGA
jgi:hypothetical protein